ncbi:MAG: sensor domain-containing diguanylate cyclase [Sporomusaceae bacterium]|nr:sensor domain-containing diguanylate cyclase [Sporomusaceae bacterium]
MRFFYKITALFILFVVLGGFIQILVFDKYFVTETDSTLLNLNQQASAYVSDQISAYFTKVQNALEVIASNKSIQEDQTLLDEINKMLPEINRLVILNKQGDIIKISDNKKSTVLSNLSSKEYYLQAMQGNKWITNVFTSASGKKVVAIAVPIKNNHAIDGAVIAYIELHGNALASMFDNKSFGENGYISIIDSQGYVVYHQNKERIGQKTHCFENLTGDAGVAVLTDFTNSEQYTGYHKVPGLNWLVTVNTSTSEIKAARNIIVFEITILSILGIGLITLVGVYSVRRSLRPFEELMQAFKTLKKGKYELLNTNRLPKELHEIGDIYNSTVNILKINHEELKEAAETDLLTGAYNRRSFYKKLAELEKDYKAENLSCFSVALVDLDHFKSINDTQGHSAGDEILKTFISILYFAVDKWHVFRFGGDEFAIIFEEKDYEEISSIAEKIRSDAESLLSGCTVSIGIASFPTDSTSKRQLVELADNALYISKQERNKITFYR